MQIDFPVTDDQVAAYREHGFLSVDGLTTQDEIDELRVIYDRLFESNDVSAGDRVDLAPDTEGRSSLPQILNPDQYAPKLRDTTAYRNASAIARRLLGDDVEQMGMHAIRKPPRAGAETPWHQDEAYWDPGWDHDALSVWMPLQPATLDNGCMQFVAGSHLLDVQPHELIDEASDGLRVVDPSSVGTATPCPLPPGGATVHHGRTMHYAGANRTDQPRRALIMMFRAPPQHRDSARSFPWQKPEWYGS